MPLIRDQSGRVVPDSEDGKTARATLGDEEYGAKAARQIRYMGSGAWANVGGGRQLFLLTRATLECDGRRGVLPQPGSEHPQHGVRDEQNRSLIHG